MYKSSKPLNTYKPVNFSSPLSAFSLRLLPSPSLFLPLARPLARPVLRQRWLPTSSRCAARSSPSLTRAGWRRWGLRWPSTRSPCCRPAAPQRRCVRPASTSLTSRTSQSGRRCSVSNNTSLRRASSESESDKFSLSLASLPLLSLCLMLALAAPSVRLSEAHVSMPAAAAPHYLTRRKGRRREGGERCLAQVWRREHVSASLSPFSLSSISLSPFSFLLSPFCCCRLEPCCSALAAVWFFSRSRSLALCSRHLFVVFSGLGPAIPVRSLRFLQSRRSAVRSRPRCCNVEVQHWSELILVQVCSFALSLSPSLSPPLSPHLSHSHPSPPPLSQAAV